ncbi:MAG: hypothetical protein JWN32_1924 [Solirubrobacterales bacterium]|nr:hypothetical protein [Solirubrobacterales bacterium]
MSAYRDSQPVGLDTVRGVAVLSNAQASWNAFCRLVSTWPGPVRWAWAASRQDDAVLFGREPSGIDARRRGAELESRTERLLSVE